MGYINALTKDELVLVWERVDGERILKKYRAPYYYYFPADDGQYRGMHGERLAKMECTNRSNFKQFKEQYTSDSYKDKGRCQIYEADLAPELKILSQVYYGQPAPVLHVTFHDIEVDYDERIGFASTQNPYAPINAVALYHTHGGKYVVLVVPPDNNWNDVDQLWQQVNGIEPIDATTEIIICANEKELLLNYLAEIEDSDVLAGWNSDFFDMPYIVKRMELTLGKKYASQLSFDEAPYPYFKEVEQFGKVNLTVDLHGRISTDYLALFKKYEMANRPSYKLEAIADEILPNLPKLKYEGTLHQLYRKNFPYFVRYNIRDTEILKGFEDTLGYVELSNQMYHLSTGLFKHVTGTVKLAELAIINYCHHVLDTVVPDASPERADGTIQGAYVLDPKIGMHEWVGSIDINSLYPSSIRSINISPEKIVGQFSEDVKAAEEISKQSFANLTLVYEDDTQETHTADDWWKILWDNKWSVSGYGTVFNQDKQGVIPAILTEWFATRKKYQAMKKDAEKAGDKAKAAYYDRLQYIFKIKLNSTYGALSNYNFRFFDLRMGESTTGTGRMILRHQCATVNQVLEDQYDPTGDAVIYGDTDSTYFNTYADNADNAVKIADAVADKVNKSYQQFMINTFRCQPEFDNIIKAGRELVSDRGIFVDKKRYILHVIDIEGKRVDKLKTMGLELKKTTLPKYIQEKLSSFIERLLKGETWQTIANDIIEYKDYLKHTIPDSEILMIGLPKGANKVEHYAAEYKRLGLNARLPGHIAAAIHYNENLIAHDDKASVPITSGTKLKVFYLKQQIGKFKSIALPTDTEIIPSWFLDFFVPQIDKDAQIERLIDDPLENILTAIGYDVPSKQDLVVNDLLSF
jgi:DNA polymerase elongation subunit (family B)